MAFLACLAVQSSVLAESANLDDHAGKPILHQDGFNQPGPAVSGGAAAPAGKPVELDSWRVLMALVGVLSLILVLRWGSQKILPASLTVGRAAGLKILARHPLGPRQQVVLLQVGKRIIVAADCASQLSTLCQITDADEVAGLIGEIARVRSSPATRPFTSWFARATEAFKTDEQEAEAADAGSLNPDEDVRAAATGQRAELGVLSEKVREMLRQFGKPGGEKFATDIKTDAHR